MKLNERRFDCNVPVSRNMDEIMYRKQISRIELGKRLGIPDHMVSNLINGRKIIKPYMIPEIAKALGVPVKDLFKEV